MNDCELYPEYRNGLDNDFNRYFVPSNADLNVPKDTIEAAIELLNKVKKADSFKGGICNLVVSEYRGKELNNDLNNPVALIINDINVLCNGYNYYTEFICLWVEKLPSWDRNKSPHNYRLGAVENLIEKYKLKLNNME